MGINWTPSRDGSSNPITPFPRRRHSRSGFWAAILKGIRGYGELVNNKKSKDISREDLMSGLRIGQLFIREPEFVGQTKDRLATVKPKLVENAVRDHLTIGLHGYKICRCYLDFLVLRAEERMRRRLEKETQRKTVTKTAPFTG